MSYDKDMDARSMTRDEDEEELSLGEEFDDDEVVPTQTVTPAQTPSGSVNVPTSVRSMADQFPASFKRALGAAEAEKNGQRVEGPSATSASTMTPVAVSTSGAPSSDVPSTRKSPRTARTTSTVSLLDPETGGKKERWSSKKEMIALRGEVNSVMNSVTKRVQTKEGLADQRDTLKRQRQADSDSEDSDESWRGPPPAKESGRRKAPLPKKRTRRERSESDSSASGGELRDKMDVDMEDRTTVQKKTLSERLTAAPVANLTASHEFGVSSAVHDSEVPMPPTRPRAFSEYGGPAHRGRGWNTNRGRGRGQQWRGRGAYPVAGGLAPPMAPTMLAPPVNTGPGTYRIEIGPLQWGLEPFGMLMMFRTKIQQALEVSFGSRIRAADFAQAWNKWAENTEYYVTVAHELA